ncbi:hypothetical protein [Kitasatospora sp. NPDC088351]|uniref:hypothetical protein n=1 Tax=Kitasatospora sp. NPDC088351 TaxID=3155180 RepID=UPI0034430362
MGQQIQTTHLQRLDTDRWDARVPAGQLVGLGEAFDAAERLAARRDFLAGSPQNLERERVLRERPEDYGVVGRLMLGAENVLWVPDGSRTSGTVQLLGPECTDGYQRIALVARLATDLSPAHLDRAVLDVRIVTGPAREQARAEHDRAYLYHHPTTAQDLLTREPVMCRLVKQFDRDRLYFRLHRGERRGPHRTGYSVDEATTALALFSCDALPALGHLALDESGREEIWWEPSAPAFRALFNQKTQATGVRIAIMIRRTVHRVLAEMSRVRSDRHWHLLEDAPDLVVWAVARNLPIDRLHDDERAPDAPAWESIHDHEVPELTRRTAERMVKGYLKVRPKGVHRKSEVGELSKWHEILQAAKVI